MATILGIQTINEVSIYEVDGDPSAGAGTPAPRGSLAIHSASGTVWIKRLAADTGWEPVSTSASSTSFRARYEAHDDFITNLVGSALGWSASASGTGASVSINTVNVPDSVPWEGSLQLTAGTTATGYAGIFRAVNQITLSNRVYTQEWRIFLPVLSNATDSFFVRAGFIDAIPSEPVDGVYFRYNHAVNGGQWQCVLRYNNAETVANSTIPAVAGQAINLTIRSDHQTSATYTFYVNDTLAGTITSSLVPAGSARYTGIAASIVKNAGTTSRIMVVDYYHEIIQFYTSR